MAIVTGASKGIGASIDASSKEGADRVIAEIARDGGRAIAVQAGERREGGGDILVNNAGIYVLGLILASKEVVRHSSGASTLTPCRDQIAGQRAGPRVTSA